MVEFRRIGGGYLAAQKRLPNDCRSLLGLLGLLCEVTGAEGMAARGGTPLEAMGEGGVLFKGAQSDLQGVFQGFGLLGEQDGGGIRMADPAAVALERAVFYLPQDAVAFGAGECGGRSGMVSLQ